MITRVSSALLSFTVLAAGCSSSDGSGATGPTGEDDSGASEVSSDAPSSDASGLDSSVSEGSIDSAREDTPPFDGSPEASAMPLISGGVPAFSSDGAASGANDDNPASGWGTASTSGWLAYDLSATPVAQRQKALIGWYAIHSGCYIDEASPPKTGQRPLAYTIETNTAPGGTKSAPTTGWTPVTTIADNRYCNRHHVIDLAGASWVRINVSKSTRDGVYFDFSVYSAPDGGTDSWLFMGDSITYMTMTYAFSDLPSQVHGLAKDHWPAVIDAAIGGTNTGTAMAIIDDTLRDFPGRFVVLAYGTNDHADSFHMKELVDHVIAAGKTPVVPHMPWSSGSAEGAKINTLIDALYAAEPKIVRGPDLWKGLEGHTEWIPVGDVHPTGVGQTEIRREWSIAMAATYR